MTSGPNAPEHGPSGSGSGSRTIRRAAGAVATVLVVGFVAEVAGGDQLHLVTDDQGRLRWSTSDGATPSTAPAAAIPATPTLAAPPSAAVTGSAIVSATLGATATPAAPSGPANPDHVGEIGAMWDSSGGAFTLKTADPGDPNRNRAMFVGLMNKGQDTVPVRYNYASGGWEEDPNLEFVGVKDGGDTLVPGTETTGLGDLGAQWVTLTYKEHEGQPVDERPRIHGFLVTDWLDHPNPDKVKGRAETGRLVFLVVNGGHTDQAMQQFGAGYAFSKPLNGDEQGNRWPDAVDGQDHRKVTANELAGALTVSRDSLPTG